MKIFLSKMKSLSLTLATPAMGMSIIRTGTILRILSETGLTRSERLIPLRSGKELAKG